MLRAADIHMTKLSKLPGPEQVSMFFDQLEHPLKSTIELIHKIILDTDETITEHIKWNAPSYCHGGDDRVTFNLHKDGHILLIFHRGAKPKAPKNSGRLIDDRSGLLEWPAKDRAVLKFTGLDDVIAKKAILESIIRKWIDAAAD